MTNNPTQSVEDVVEEFKERNKYSMEDHSCCFDYKEEENWIRDKLTTQQTQHEKELRDAKNEARLEIEHEQRKFIDGFAHPKDCKRCKALTDNK